MTQNLTDGKMVGMVTVKSFGVRNSILKSEYL